jgi:hypothetical protein
MKRKPMTRDERKNATFAKNYGVAPSQVLRVPVNFNYTGLNFDFLKLMAEIVPYADEKYTSYAQFTKARLEGQASPLNHIIEHARQYMAGETYDHFDGDIARHLAAIAYNASMEFFYLRKYGHVPHPLFGSWGARMEHVTLPPMGGPLEEAPKKKRKKARR